jgi:hypothetical protein
MAGPFSVGDVILFGKYKNKRGRIVTFGTNHKGQATVEIEPIPKGRKKNKELGLYKIWTIPQESAMQGESRLNRLVEEVTIFERVDEKLIQRAAMILGAGGDEKKAAQTLQKSGVSRQDAYLAIKAAKILIKNEAIGKRVRRRKPGSGSRKIGRRCPTGMHMKKQGSSGPGRCVRVPSSKKHAARRYKKKYAKKASGKKSAKRSARFAKRYNRR